MKRNQQKRLDEQYQAKRALLSAHDKTLDMEFTRDELEREQAVMETIAQRATQLQTELGAPGRVTKLRLAEAPDRPVERLPLKKMMLAMMACGCLPFGFVYFRELSIRRIADVDQLSEQSQLSVVGEVAKLPLWTSVGNMRRGKGLSLFEESIDSLRVCLWLPEERKNVQVLSVCSAVHGEGKTSVASQLAVSMAKCSRTPVLIIDADMRSPDIFQIFKISNDPGLAALLDRRCTLDEALVTDWSERVHVLPAGKLTKSPHKLLSDDVFPALLSTLRVRYTHIIIDTPPVLSAAEALLLAKWSDGTIICTRRNYSRERQVKLARERLVAAGAKPLGAVFNAVPTRRYAYTYGSYDYSPKLG
ncbi:MAG: tyrosine-protein kinase family protein [Pirellulaceae bacterium]